MPEETKIRGLRAGDHHWEISGMFEGDAVECCVYCGMLRRKRREIKNSIKLIKGFTVLEYFYSNKWNRDLPKCEKNPKNINVKK